MAMTVRTAVILPLASSFDPVQVAQALQQDGWRVLQPPIVTVPAGVPAQLADMRQVAGLAQWLKLRITEEPFVLVSDVATTSWLPAIALSQRAAHHRLVGYVIVNANLPNAGETWPDAQVTWVVNEHFTGDRERAMLTTRLRGYLVAADQTVTEAVQGFAHQ